jgi:hypothetical protein
MTWEIITQEPTCTADGWEYIKYTYHDMNKVLVTKTTMPITLPKKEHIHTYAEGVTFNWNIEYNYSELLAQYGVDTDADGVNDALNPDRWTLFGNVNVACGEKGYVSFKCTVCEQDALLTVVSEHIWKNGVCVMCGLIKVDDTIKLFDCGNMGDYSDTPLYRILLTENDAAPYDFTNFCANEYGGEVLKWIKINGKSIYDHRAEYQAAVKAGERAPVISKQPNIAANQSADNAYAPIFVWFTSHAPALNSKAIDIFIPNDYLPRDQVKSIEITKDFTTDHINEKTGTTATTSYTLSQNVYWAIGGGIRATKHVGGKPAYTTTATTITAPFLKAYEATNFFSTQLAVSDYANAGSNNICIPKETMDTLNFWSYVELNGVSLNKMISDLNSKAIPGEIGFNVFGAQSALSFRFPSFTAEYFNSLTEIKYLKGCQFPSFANPTSAVYELTEDVTFVKYNGAWVKANLKTAEDVTFGGGYIAGDNKEIVKFEIAINDFAWTEEDRDGFDWNYGAGQALRESIKINGKSLYEIAKTVDDSNYVYTGIMANAGKNDDGLDRFQNPAIVQGNIKNTGNKMYVWVHKDYLATLGDEVTITISAGTQNWTKDATLTEDVSQTYYKYADGLYATAKTE